MTTTLDNRVDPEVYDVLQNLDKSFSQRRKDRRRAKIKDEIQKKEEDNITNQTQQTQVYKLSPDEKQRERFRKMGYVRRVKFLMEDVEELRRTGQENRRLIKELSTRVNSMTGKTLTIKFNAQLLQKELLNFLTYDKKEGKLVIIDGVFTRIEE